MKLYCIPKIMIMEANAELLIVSEMGPGAGDIGSPSVRYNSKSVWDEEIEDNETIDYEI